MYLSHLLTTCIVFPTIANIINKISKLYSIGKFVPLENYHMHYSKWPPIATFIIFKYEMPFVVIKIVCLSHELFKLHTHVFLMPFYSPSLKLGSGTTHLFYAWCIHTQKCYYKYFFSYILYTIEIVSVQCFKKKKK